MQAGHQAKYQDIVATVVSVAIHAIVLTFLLLNLNITTSAFHAEQTEVEPILSEVVDEIAIREEQERQAEEERRRQREGAARQARLAQAEREAEDRRQAEIRRQKEEEAKRRAAAEAKRQAAEEAKREAAEEAKRQAATEAKRAAAEEAKRQAAAEDAKRRAAEEAKRAAAEEEARRKAEEARELAQKLAAQERAKAAAAAHAGNVIGPYVERHWNPVANTSGGLVCSLRITITTSGQVTNVQIVKGSGDSLFDNSAVAAVHRASPLPMPGDSAVAQELRPTFILRFRPK